MNMEVGLVRVLYLIFDEVVNNCFGLNLYPFRSVNNKRLILSILCL